MSPRTTNVNQARPCPRKRRSAWVRAGVWAMAMTVACLAFAPSALADFGLSSYEVSTSEAAPKAGSHPDFDVALHFESPVSPIYGIPMPEEQFSTLVTSLPAGFIGDAGQLPTCSRERFELAAQFGSPCPADTQVGEVLTSQALFGPGPPDGIFNIEPGPGEPAKLGLLFAGQIPIYIDIDVRNESDYGLVATTSNIPNSLPITDMEFKLWGMLAPSNGSGAPAARAFMTYPPDCTSPLDVGLKVRSYEQPERWIDVSGALPAPTGCQDLDFQPTIKVTPETTAPDTPTGVTFDLDFPQSDDPNGLAQVTPALRDAVIDLPEGMSINPAVAGGLGACTDAQSAIGTPDAASCPEAAKIGTASLDVPALRKPLTGGLYVGSQESDDPASGKMFRLFLVADGQGVHLKLEGAVRADPVTGRLQATFADNPQVPVSSIHLAFKGGPRAVLVTPPSCGSNTVDAHLASWGGQAVDIKSSFDIDCTPGLGAFAPSLSAGSATSAAGRYSPFNLRVTRPNGQQNVSTIQATLPEGVLAKLAGVPLCDDGAAATGDCPSASQVGTTTVGTGAGSNLLYVPQPGKEPTGVYLAGPYKGAPYSLVAKVPAQAGPFDLGTVAVRNALQIDPTTTRVTAISDPLPQVVGGIPISYRDIRIEMNRPEFTVNPTSCDPTAVTGTIGSSTGASAAVSDPFQVTDCAALGFAPKLALRLSGAPPRRGANPALKATLTPANGNANIGTASVILPGTELLEQAHIKTVCTRVQFAANECPAGSIYGHAKAWTPLLDTPLEGPVYLRSNGGERKLPDLVADLNGSIHVVLVGYIDSVKRHGSPRIRTRFLEVPDAPVSRFVLEMQRGKKSLLANNTNLCKAKPRAEAALGGQNGKESETRPLVKVSGCGKGGKAAKKK